ncbi:lipopolysaccharide assembly protein b [Anaeramoeba ignava]|uniref:Lipopolysaccharide assembly protein b n=1 Tax=Anaeramoeba ignava TaxID=1746090 RepID=A0A9Q0RCL0_ANAIG|nr:lipopolysaccharide assembly protein b [Anaeramoeba ignava]
MQNKEIIRNSVKLLFKYGNNKKRKNKTILSLEKIKNELFPFENWGTNFHVHFYLGKLYFEKFKTKEENCSKSKENFILELKHNPKSFESCFYLSKINFFQSNYEESRKYCEKAIEMKENNIPINLLLSSIYLKIGANENLYQALELAKKAFNLSKSQPKIEMRRKCVFLIAQIYYKQQDSVNFQNWCDENFDFSNPGDCFVYSLYNFQYGNYQQIEKYLKSFLNLSSFTNKYSKKREELSRKRRDLANFLLVIMEKRKQNFQKAIKRVNQIKQRETYKLRINIQLGDIYFLQNDFDNAKKYFLESLQNLSDNSLKYNVLFRLACIFKQMGNNQEVLNVLSEVKIENISDDELLFQFGLLYKEMNNIKDAIFCLEKVIQQNGKKLETYICLGNILEKKYLWKQYRYLVSYFLENVEVEDPDQHLSLKKIPYFGIHPSMFINQNTKLTEQYVNLVNKIKSLDRTKWNVHGLFLFNNYITIVTENFKNTQPLNEEIKISLNSVDLMEISVLIAGNLNRLLDMDWAHGNLDIHDILFFPQFFNRKLSHFELNFSKSLGLRNFQTENNLNNSKKADLKWFEQVFLILSQKTSRKPKFINDIIQEFRKPESSVENIIKILKEILWKEYKIRIRKF